MLQASVLNVSFVFLDVRCKCVYVDVAYGPHICVASVLSGCYVCLQWFSSVFANILNACFKCFIYLQTYIASVATIRFKSRPCVAHVTT